MKMWRSHLRLLASFLLLASPAVGGTVLPLAHPCPVDSPWLADSESGDSHHGHHGTATQPGDSTGELPSGHDSHTDCSCIGFCATPALLLAPQGVVALVAAVEVPSASPQWTVVDAIEVRQQLLDLLPPTTAPPQV